MKGPVTTLRCFSLLSWLVFSLRPVPRLTFPHSADFLNRSFAPPFDNPGASTLTLLVHPVQRPRSYTPANPPRRENVAQLVLGGGRRAPGRVVRGNILSAHLDASRWRIRQTPVGMLSPHHFQPQRVEAREYSDLALALVLQRRL